MGMGTQIAHAPEQTEAVSSVGWQSQFMIPVPQPKIENVDHENKGKAAFISSSRDSIVPRLLIEVGSVPLY